MFTTKKEVLDAAARGEGCLGKSQDDEPVFVLVGRDACASHAIRSWANFVDAQTLPDSASRRKSIQARLDAVEFDRWRAARGGGKMPD